MPNYSRKQPALFTERTNKSGIGRNMGANAVKSAQKQKGCSMVWLVLLYIPAFPIIRHLVGIASCFCDGTVIQ